MSDPLERWPEARRVFRLPFSGRRAAREVEEELAFHLEGRIEQFVAAGMSRAEAEWEARRRFGDYDRHRARTRALHEQAMTTRNRSEQLSGLAREVAHAARVLWRTPSFSLMAALTLALGIGATTAIYMVVDTVILRPLPYQDADRLVSVLHPTVAPGSDPQNWGLSAAGYFHLKAENRTLTNLGAYRTNGMVVTGGQGAEVVQRGLVTASLLPTLGASASLGRLLQEEDDRPGAPLVAVISHEFWQRRFGGAPDILGRPLLSTEGGFTIVGVARPGLTLPKPGPFASSANLAGFGVDVWVPLQLDPLATPQNNHALAGIGRLRDGVTATEAQADLQRLTDRFPDLFPTAYSERFITSYQFRAGVVPLRDDVLGPTLVPTLWVLFGAVGLVLLIACANVANLFLVRMEVRRRESAIRTALGADRFRMLVHFLAESLLLTLTAAVGGLGLAWAGLRALLVIAPTNIPRLAQVTVRPAAVVFALLLALAVGVILGLVPIARTRVDVPALRAGGRGATTGRGSRRVRHGLVVAQVALALILLSAAGLMLKSVVHLRQVRPGLDATGVLTVGVALPYAPQPSLEAAVAFHRQVLDQVAALPGVVTVGATTNLPLRDFGYGCSVVFREGVPFSQEEGTPCVATPVAAPGFFAALGIAVEGREPTWSDVDQRTNAVVVTRVLADRLWPGQDPIGKGINSNSHDSPLGFFRVVGVVEHLQAQGLDQPGTEAVFYPAAERLPGSRNGSAHALTYVVRTSLADPMSLLPRIREIVRGLDPDVPVTEAGTMAAVLAGSMARSSFVMTLLSLAGAMALALSAVGIFGVVSYLVAQRRAEIGVRMALGADPGQVARLVMGQSVGLVLAGVGLGLVGALFTTRTLQAMLHGVRPNDPLVLAGMSVLLVAIAVVASLGPTRRAARVPPVEVLRAE